MISKFFIEHPVLANVLAIVLVVIGAVSLYRLPVSEYPNVVPPTVQVTASYPGASAQTVIDTVALPIENQVNGVDRMLYMQSTSAPDGTYSLTVTFAIGTDPNIDQVLVQNRVQLALASLPEPVQAQGVSVQKKNTAILQIVTLDSPDRKFDSLVHEQLRDDQPDRRARPPARRRQRQGVRRGQLLDAHLDGSAAPAVVRPAAEGRHRRHPRAKPEHRRRPGRHAARSARDRVPVYGRRPVAARPAGGVRQHRRQGSNRAGRPAHPSARRRPDRAWRADLFAGLQGQRAARRRHRHLPDAGLQLAAGRQGSEGHDGRHGQALPGRPALRDSRTIRRSSSRSRSPRSTRLYSRPASSF